MSLGLVRVKVRVEMPLTVVGVGLKFFEMYGAGGGVDNIGNARARGVIGVVMEAAAEKSYSSELSISVPLPLSTLME